LRGKKTNVQKKNAYVKQQPKRSGTSLRSMRVKKKKIGQTREKQEYSKIFKG